MTLIERTIVASLLVALGVYAGLFKTNATIERYSAPVGTLEIASNVPSGEVLRMLSLGHNEALADLLWLNALSYYGQYAHLDTEITWLDPHINAITTVDPRFRLVFEWAGSVIMYSTVIDNESVQAANRFLQLGVDRFPNDWNLRFMLGMNYYFELQPSPSTTPEELAEWRRFGAEQLAVAAGLPNAPTNLQLTAVSFLRRGAPWSRQVQTYRESFLNADEGAARTLRRSLHLSMPPDEAALWMARRRLVTESLRRDLQWGFPPFDLALALHPSPTHLYAPSELTPYEAPE